ncbi:MAG: DUF3592 domain-containing protein [Clostridia bacterium]|nr:DUF3592 domain-containing protein [Clostridia bacterium]
MGIENKMARFSRNTGPARFFIPVGIILIVFGIILLGFKTENYAETTGKVTFVTESVSDEENGKQYDVSFTYAVDGKEYDGVFSNVSGDYIIGGDIKVYYDPAAPEKTTNGKMPSFAAPVIIAIGLIAVAVGVYKTVKAFRKSKALDESAGAFPSESFENFKNASGVKEIYFRFDGNSLKPGYIIEDADRKVLFEGKMIKQAVVGARTYEFRNNATGSVAAHEVGHTVTQTYNDGFFTAKSYFKFDGENVWDVIHNRGIRLSTNFHSNFPYVIYDAAKEGAPFARIESCGIYVHEDEAEQHKVNIPSGSRYYRIWTNSSDLELIFLTTFAISETEQAVVE